MQHKYTVGDTSFIDKKKIHGSLGYGREELRCQQTTALYKEIKFKLTMVTEKNNMDIFSLKEKSKK